ncbi:uncharacterized protein LOC144747105 [Ciona intestinalis]
MYKLDLNERELSTQNRIILHEAVEQLANPQGLIVNDISGDRWSKDWKLYKDQSEEGLMQILLLPPGKIKSVNIRDVTMLNSMTQAILPHLDVMDKLDYDEVNCSARNRFLLHEAVERLINPQGLTVNGNNGDRWSKYWDVYENEPDEYLMQVLQLPPGKIKELYLGDIKKSDSTTQALLPHIDVMDKLQFRYMPNNMNFNLYIEDISRKIMNRQNKIQIGIDAPLDKNATQWLSRCLSNVSVLGIIEKTLSVQNRIILHEAVEQLTNPQVSVFFS